ncbi:MAG: PEP-CTERM sorting domain-containing protein [Phycisphaerales bacterium]|nr:PEP-CTERM sorting domain-containing protein [Phycisphaerales bacterium]MCB9840911.1 PEP-CTERM sorting domain-containing protein [Phycisphaeraceae bacterium]
MKTMILAGATVALATVAQAGTIATLPPNNGSGGVFMEITPTGPGLLLTSFAGYFNGAAGSTGNVEIWTRPGNYAGFTASNAGWTLADTVTITSAGTTTLSGHTSFNSAIAIPAGGTTSVYIAGTISASQLRYQGTGTTSTSTFSNADLTLFSNIARTGAIPFGGSQFTPRAFAGEINYDFIPAPASLALMGLGGLVAGRRRR